MIYALVLCTVEDAPPRSPKVRRICVRVLSCSLNTLGPVRVRCSLHVQRLLLTRWRYIFDGCRLDRIRGRDRATGFAGAPPTRLVIEERYH